MSNEPRNELLIQGPVGQIQLLIDYPDAPAKGVVVLSHPQPLLGGSPRHIVPLTLARRLCAAGWQVVRPCYRGVGKTEGEHADGIGECDDTLAVIRHVQGHFPELPLALVGFSFGAYVHARAVCALAEPPCAVALLGLPVGDVPGGRYYEPLPLPGDVLLLHGEQDEMAPLANLLDWARPRQRAVTLYSGANHFFKGCLESAAQQVIAHLASRL
ncbi:alpha/beta hydrolase [Pseudomonas sp. Teo4]|uniref:alpha/beta hydrolase n=1 Tax=Pseudomonas sp. Teo4 TaxID=3064528 RepID=UPI002ABA05C1|nr:alpha/beta hydrolase [Pseudomonas sp. Teo4]MDZ3991632.1 hypothetical protein [Pseudomonas sp. Teo4]